jgi:hypothetical protein
MGKNPAGSPTLKLVHPQTCCGTLCGVLGARDATVDLAIRSTRGSRSSPSADPMALLAIEDGTLGRGGGGRGGELLGMRAVRTRAAIGATSGATERTLQECSDFS